MIEEPRITELEAATTAYIPIKVAREKMPEVFAPAVQELLGTLSEQGVEISGPMFAHHLEMDPATFTFEAGFSIARPVTPAGRVKAGQRPTLRVARTVHHGPYDGLPDAWGEFQHWIEMNDLHWAPDIWECYLVNPDSEPDPAKWRTELNRPLLR